MICLPFMKTRFPSVTHHFIQIPVTSLTQWNLKVLPYPSEAGTTLSGTTHRTNVTSTETQTLNMEEFKRRLQRWGERETAAIAQVRARLGALLINRPQFPEVVGDRKLLRFFKGFLILHLYVLNCL